ncbi:VENN motif pre-toxin domain-containing protein [Pantoea sp. ACRSH]|nr:VENN motif pre-toxin domain-containing protein [Pantoea sp. ACRSH]
MAAGLAGGIASDSTLGGGTGAGAGKNAVENNALSGKDAQEKNSIELALSETGLALHPGTPEEVAALEERHDQLTNLTPKLISMYRVPVLRDGHRQPVRMRML